MTQQTFITSDTWTCPSGVTEVTAECWGGGGAGGGDGASGAAHDRAAGGGAGGSYASKIISVTAGSVYTVTVAAAKVGAPTSTASANTGNTSWFLANSASGCVAVGGPGAPPWTTDDTGGPGANGTSTGCIGDTVEAGGNGSAAGGTGQGAAGGAGAHSGGAGGAAQSFTDGPGSAGTAPGGGGGGAGNINSGNAGNAGGTGAAGRIILTWTASSQNYTQPAADIETLADTTVQALSMPRSQSDALTLQDTPALTFSPLKSDLITLQDSVGSVLSHNFTQTPGDIVTLGDSLISNVETLPLVQFTAYTVNVGVN